MEGEASHAIVAQKPPEVRREKEYNLSQLSVNDFQGAITVIETKDLKTELLFHKQPNGIYRFLLPHQLAMAGPQDATHLAVSGDEGKLSPLKDTFTADEMRQWLADVRNSGCQLSATDGRSNLRSIEI
jgi:hypothetical protein